MTDNRSLESKLLALSKGQKVVLTAEEKKLIGKVEEASTSKTVKTSQKVVGW